MATVKEELIKLVQDRPEEGSGEEIEGRLTFHVLVERGIANLNAMGVIAKREMARRIRER